MNEAMKMKYINQQIPDELHTKLKTIAAKEEKNLKDIVLVALSKFAENGEEIR